MIWLLLFLGIVGPSSIPRSLEGVNLTHGEKRVFKITFYCSCKKCCGRFSPQKGGHGDTTLGNTPLPWRTAASGDPALAGRWVLLPDLGGEVYVSDTGVTCKGVAGAGGSARGRSTTGAKGRGRLKKPWSGGCVAPNQLDIFVGGPEHHVDALRLGVMWWEGEVRP